MKNYRSQASFDQAAAEIYDQELRGDEDAATDFLAGLAADGPALELALHSPARAARTSRCTSELATSE